MLKKDINKEALFNEIKGSLFEFLVARNMAVICDREGDFLTSIHSSYLNVLSKQDFMMRSFYAEMASFLQRSSLETAQFILKNLSEKPSAIRLQGKISEEPEEANFGEADILLFHENKITPLSLKLTKKNSYINTKSAGVRSFFRSYFPFIDEQVQDQFNEKVDFEFNQLAFDLHTMNDLVFDGSFKQWVAAGKSELPGELTIEEREVLKKYYSRLSFFLYEELDKALRKNAELFLDSCLKLMGFQSQEIIQIICFHDFFQGKENEIFFNSIKNMSLKSNDISLKKFQHTASVDIKLSSVDLQIRIKPMNKFTTTAMKVNCAVRLPNVF